MRDGVGLTSALRALLGAPPPGLVVPVIAEISDRTLEPTFVIMLGILLLGSYAAAAVAVVPVFALFPGSRVPSLPVAAAWGAGVAVMTMLAVTGTRTTLWMRPVAIVSFLVMGVSAGMTYVILLRRIQQQAQR